MQTLVSTRFDPETLERLDEAVSNLGRTRSGFIKEAVQHYLEYLTWYTAEVQQGLDAIKAGKAFSHEELGRMLKDKGVALD